MDAIKAFRRVTDILLGRSMHKLLLSPLSEPESQYLLAAQQEVNAALQDPFGPGPIDPDKPYELTSSELADAMVKVEAALDPVESNFKSWLQSIPEDERVVEVDTTSIAERFMAGSLPPDAIKGTDLMQALLDLSGPSRELLMAFVPMSGWYSLSYDQCVMLFDAEIDIAPCIKTSMTSRHDDMALLDLDKTPLFLAENEGLLALLATARQAAITRRKCVQKTNELMAAMGRVEHLLSLDHADILNAIRRKVPGWSDLLAVLPPDALSSRDMAVLLASCHGDVRCAIMMRVGMASRSRERYDRVRNERLTVAHLAEAAEKETMKSRLAKEFELQLATLREQVDQRRQVVQDVYARSGDTDQMLSLTHADLAKPVDSLVHTKPSSRPSSFKTRIVQVIDDVASPAPTLLLSPPAPDLAPLQTATSRKKAKVSTK